MRWRCRWSGPPSRTARHSGWPSVGRDGARSPRRRCRCAPRIGRPVAPTGAHPGLAARSSLSLEPAAAQSLLHMRRKPAATFRRVERAADAPDRHPVRSTLTLSSNWVSCRCNLLRVFTGQRLGHAPGLHAHAAGLVDRRCAAFQLPRHPQGQADRGERHQQQGGADGTQLGGKAPGTRHGGTVLEAGNRPSPSTPPPSQPPRGRAPPRPSPPASCMPYAEHPPGLGLRSALPDKRISSGTWKSVTSTTCWLPLGSNPTRSVS